MDAMRWAARAALRRAKDESARAIGTPPRTADELRADYDDYRMENYE